jgi:serine/threonine protein kinase
MQYLHSAGIVHCDIRPKNMLIDEYGVLKLCDFKFVRRLPRALEAAEQTAAALLPSAALAYSSPEVLDGTGVVSFSSDLWSLGCVMYQLRRGVLPFGSAIESDVNHRSPSRKGGAVALQERLLRRIAAVDDVIRAPYQDPGSDSSKLTSVTAEFADLISWLLEKKALHRITW